ncbi:MAG: V-type ATP synthase subunit E family protein, partial [Halobacteriaceae archaeon]
EDDIPLLETIVSDYEGFSVAGKQDCLGGVIVEGEASRIRVNNTFDSILDEVWEEELKNVSDILFGER